jgi:hypothetical protein
VPLLPTAGPLGFFAVLLVAISALFLGLLVAMYRPGCSKTKPTAPVGHLCIFLALGLILFLTFMLKWMGELIRAS